MRAYEFITEDYKTAKVLFTNAGANPAEVDAVITQYKELVKKNQFSSPQNNIDNWPKLGFDAFKKAVTDKSSEPTTTAVKRKKLPGKCIILRETDDWLIVLPLDKDSSCYHGRKSDWCTTKTNRSSFEDYFYNNEITLIYCLQIKTGNMWAIAAHKDTDKIECFTQQDKPLTTAIFNQQTGLDAIELRNIALGEEHKPKVQQSRDTYKAAVKQIEKWLRLNINEPNADIEKLLLFTKNGALCCDYLEQTRTLNEVIQYFAVMYCSTAIQFITDPSEDVQIAAVTKHGPAIEYILDKKIVPSEKVQIAAVKQNGDAIFYIKKPSEDVKLAAVKQNGYAIFYIKKPSEDVKLAAVKQNGNAIFYIKNPTEKVIAASTHQIKSSRTN